MKFNSEEIEIYLDSINVDLDDVIELNNGFNVLKETTDPKRHYHNWEHVLNVIDYIEKLDISDADYKILIITALYHDIVYDPKSTTNEEDSAKYIDNLNLSIDDIIIIRDLIIFTKYNRQPETELEKHFLAADLSIFNKSYDEQLVFEKNILKEYNFVSLDIYVPERIKVLKKLKEHYNTNTDFLINYLENKKWNIGIYCGSFNPFHIGHLDILKQAENIFDKVIILYSNSNKKSNFIWNEEQYGKLNPIFELYETHEITGLITDQLNIFKQYFNVTLIRGLRNGSDLLYEQNYIQTLRDIDPLLNVTYFLTKPKFAHISSSMIRELISLNFGLVEKYLPLL